MTTQLRHILRCNRTGVSLGSLDLSVTAGHLPYMSHWNEMICYHQLFSLTPYKLVDFMNREWQRLAQAITDEQASDREEELLCIGFTALLHNLNSIRQDRNCIGLPTISIVQSNLESLMGLSTWYNTLASKRFQFPELHISKLNDNASLQHIYAYLSACWDAKAAWEAGLDDQQEQERARVAERAVIAIRNGFYKPVSKKLLWTYVKAQLPAMWKGDEWLGTIFLGSTPTDWDWDELELFEEILQSALPVGQSVISHAVRERIDEIKAAWQDYYATFTIEEDGQEFISALTEELSDTQEPQLADFKSKAEFFVARAKWQLAHPTSYTRTTNTITEEARKKFDQHTQQQDNGL